jgi:hypothetical protein
MHPPIAVPWRERPRDLTGSAITSATRDEVAHATLSMLVPKSTKSAGGTLRPHCMCKLARDSSGRRARIMRLATRALKALRVAMVPLRPRYARLTALTARAASRFLGNCRRPLEKCLTTITNGATVGLPAGCDSRPLHTARCAARSNRRSQATIRSSVLGSFLGLLFVRRHARETAIESDCASASGPSADPQPLYLAELVTLPRRYACQMSIR